MHYFLVVYDRRTGTVLELKEFGEERRTEALNRRFALELEEAGNPDIEVVVLGAGSRNALLHTHARYFKTLQELADQAPLSAARTSGHEGP